jgi:hypothetical protein
MLWFVNRYSYLIFSALVLGGAAAAGSRLDGAAGPSLVVALGAALAFVQTRLRGGSSPQECCSSTRTPERPR